MLEIKHCLLSDIPPLPMQTLWASWGQWLMITSELSLSLYFFLSLPWSLSLSFYSFYSFSTSHLHTHTQTHTLTLTLIPFLRRNHLYHVRSSMSLYRKYNRSYDHLRCVTTSRYYNHTLFLSPCLSFSLPSPLPLSHFFLSLTHSPSLTRSLISSCSLPPSSRSSFKPSTYKGDVPLAFVPTNLHHQIMRVYPREEGGVHIGKGSGRFWRV